MSVENSQLDPEAPVDLNSMPSELESIPNLSTDIDPLSNLKDIIQSIPYVSI